LTQPTTQRNSLFASVKMLHTRRPSRRQRRQVQIWRPSVPRAGQPRKGCTAMRCLRRPRGAVGASQLLGVGGVCFIGRVHGNRRSSTAHTHTATARQTQCCMAHRLRRHALLKEVELLSASDMTFAAEACAASGGGAAPLSEPRRLPREPDAFSAAAVAAAPSGGGKARLAVATGAEGCSPTKMSHRCKQAFDL